MSFGEYLTLLGRKKKTIISVIIIFTLLSAVITFFMPFKYSAQSKLLVMQNNTQGLDPYNVSRSNEYVTSVLGQVVNSNSFLNDVLNAGFNINREYFTDNVDQQIKIWDKTVKSKSVNDAGIINITVYHTDKNQADQIVRAINNVLKANNKNYHSLGDKVDIKVIDQPIVSSKPVTPNIPLNLALGFVFGLIFALSFIYLFPEEQYNLSMVPFKEYEKPSQKSNLIREPGNYVNATRWQKHYEEEAKERGLNIEPRIAPAQTYFNQTAYNQTQVASQMNQIPINQNKYNVQIDDIDEANITNKGSMANIFGNQNLG
jgi:capsular polysaccharide biosynthesis protein